ncbi:MAG TPA: molybdopterin synthase catalytic subunit MoaE [Casimicrobiaceae bacterium]|jgi:molybdopterin synthase catalytic subunit|nr:molybdopterin synthase catalytic subunit MoaE [Casimicrobiaceae bacterium]
MAVRIQEQDFDVSSELATLRAGDTRVGAVATFTGLVRDLNDAAQVSTLTLEHYPGMTEKALAQIVDDAKQRWDIYDALVIHRVGPLKPGDQIVFVAVTSAHRGESFAACQFIMDYLKTRAPFWKKEQTPEGERWVEARASDEDAAARW